MVAVPIAAGRVAWANPFRNPPPGTFEAPPLKGFTVLQHSATSWELCSKYEPLGDISDSKHDIAYSILETMSN